MTPKHVYKVYFPNAVNCKKSYYFSSLAAIYTVFSVEDIGCGVGHLWNVKVSSGVPYEGKKCRISKEPVINKKQKVKA
jgi:hypothetical protein